MDNKYYPTIGLEIHAELKTLTKMFCACRNTAGIMKTEDSNTNAEIPPNTFICPVCMAHPGALPVVNKKAIENVIKVGLAIGGNISDFTEFDRKNYFYPDIPKGYQISQYKYPIVSGGNLAGFDITRVHLEEDTANNKHDRGDFSLIDFNRSGIPLMELVTEPVTFQNPEEAASAAILFAKEFQLLLWHLDVSPANMEKGEMRVEVNVSLSRDPKNLGTKVEVKNINSFRSVERAIKYELSRMAQLFDEGKEKEIIQETRGFDEGKQKTFSQRTKEGSADYRYFPEPDLPKMKLHRAFDLQKMKEELSELPNEKRQRYQKSFGVKEEDIEIYINDLVLGDWFEKVAEVLKDPAKIKIASNYITTDYIGIRKSDDTVKLPDVRDFAELADLIAQNKISSRAAKDILLIMTREGGSPLSIAKERGLFQESDPEALKIIIGNIIEANPKIVTDYKGGKEQALMSLVGLVMKETKGSANPVVARGLLVDMLK